MGQEAAFAWRVSPATAAVLFLVPLAGAVAVAFSSLDGQLFDLLTGTESPLDWSRFAAYATAAGLGAAIARRLWRAGRARAFVVYALFGAACFLIAGEQIAWGEPIVGGPAPGQTPVGAIDAMPHAADVVMLIAGAFGAAGPWIAWRLRQGRTTEAMRLTVPPLFLSSGFFLVIAYEIARVVVPGQSEQATMSLGEWSQMWLALSLMAFALLTYQRLRRASRPVLPLACGGRALR